MSCHWENPSSTQHIAANRSSGLENVPSHPSCGGILFETFCPTIFTNTITEKGRLRFGFVYLQTEGMEVVFGCCGGLTLPLHTNKPAASWDEDFLVPDCQPDRTFLYCVEWERIDKKMPFQSGICRSQAFGFLMYSTNVVVASGKLHRPLGKCGD